MSADSEGGAADGAPARHDVFTSIGLDSGQVFPIAVVLLRTALLIPDG
jgi:hypothetical protein